MASNQSKVALIQKTSNLTNIQYSHHHNYDYCRIQYRHQNYEFHYNNLQTKQFFHLTSHHSMIIAEFNINIKIMNFITIIYKQNNSFSSQVTIPTTHPRTPSKFTKYWLSWTLFNKPQSEA